MPKFNWKGKTGQTEAQWLQIVAAILAVIGHQFGYEQIAINAGVASQFIIGSVGLYLRGKEKKKGDLRKKVASVVEADRELDNER